MVRRLLSGLVVMLGASAIGICQLPSSYTERVTLRDSLILKLHTDAGDTAAGGKWWRHVDIDRMTGTRSVLYINEAILPPEGLQHRNPSLYLMCSGGRFRKLGYEVGAVLSIDAHSAALEVPQSLVSYRMDGAKVKVTQWDQSNDAKELYVDKGTTKRVLASKTFFVRVGTFTGDVVTDQFDVGGIDLATVEADCGSL